MPEKVGAVDAKRAPGMVGKVNQPPFDSVGSANQIGLTAVLYLRLLVVGFNPNVRLRHTVGGVTDPMDPTLTCVGGLATGDADGDTVHDYFVDVLPGTTVCFDIIPERNMTVEATTEPQVFMAYVDVLGDSVTVLDTRSVYFLIPPEFEGPGVPD